MSESIYDQRVLDITGSEVDFDQFRGQVLLIVNTATGCGFSRQFNQLEELYQHYRDRGLAVLGFPSNDFLGQEPLKGEKLASYCSSKYDLSFPLLERASVKGSEKQPVFQFLTGLSSPLKGDVWWNFEKFLVDRKGRPRYRFRSITSPLSRKVKRAIEELLSEK